MTIFIERKEKVAIIHVAAVDTVGGMNGMATLRDGWHRHLGNIEGGLLDGITCFIRQFVTIGLNAQCLSILPDAAPGRSEL